MHCSNVIFTLLTMFMLKDIYFIHRKHRPFQTWDLITTALGQDNSLDLPCSPYSISKARESQLKQTCSDTFAHYLRSSEKSFVSEKRRFIFLERRSHQPTLFFLSQRSDKELGSEITHRYLSMIEKEYAKTEGLSPRFMFNLFINSVAYPAKTFRP